VGITIKILGISPFDCIQLARDIENRYEVDELYLMNDLVPQPVVLPMTKILMYQCFLHFHV